MAAMELPIRYAIAVIGGATAGAEAARIFSEQGITTTIFEQNPRPYGKVEDGLPKWHVNLRRKEYDTIDRKLRTPSVAFVPKTKLGRDIEFRELVEDWGFHAVVLANGAWRDRPLPIDGAERFVDRGLIYQNPFIYWFNHNHEPSYQGQVYPVLDRTLIVGGGLASIDVAKVVQFELVRKELHARKGVDLDVETLDVRGIAAVLEEHGLAWTDLGLEGCTIYYRRRIEDMPLAEIPAGADEARRQKIGMTRRRILEKAMQKYLFRVEPLHAPVGLIENDGRLAGLVFARTRIDGGRVVLTEEMVRIETPLVISSIGSIPEVVGGVPMKGELYAYANWDLGTFADHPNVFSIGNVVTGKGNLVASRKHATQVASYMVEEFLRIADAVKRKPALEPGPAEELARRIGTAQARVGYTGDYDGWIKSVTPDGFI